MEVKMKKQGDRRAAGIALFLFLALIAVSVLPGAYADAAATKLTVSSKEYNLSVEQLPDGVTKAYAKLHDTSLKAGEYELALFDSYEAMIAMEEALEAAGEKLADIDFLAMETILYQSDEDGDYYPVEERCGVTLICPIPSPLAANAEKVQITAVSNDGKLQRIASDFVEVNGVKCRKFDIGVFDTYAFLYKKTGTLTSGASPTPTKAPVKTPTPAPTKAPAKTPTPVPTKAPAKTPTPAPTKGAVTTPTSAPTKAPEKTPVPTKKPATPTPTKALAGGSTGNRPGGESSAGVTTTPVRDKTPQTGDDFSRAGYLMLFAAGAAGLGGILLYTGRKK